MTHEPKGGSLPLIAGGLLMVACCAAPVIFGTAAIASITAWFGGFSIGETVAIAGLATLFVYGIIRLRRPKAEPDDDAPTHIAE